MIYSARAQSLEDTSHGVFREQQPGVTVTSSKGCCQGTHHGLEHPAVHCINYTTIFLGFSSTESDRNATFNISKSTL